MLGSVDGWSLTLVLRRDRLNLEEATAALENAIDRIERKLGSLPTIPTTDGGPAGTLGGGITLPDPFETEITPWLLRRLDAATNIAIQVRDDAARVLMLMDEAVAKADGVAEGAGS